MTVSSALSGGISGGESDSEPTGAMIGTTSEDESVATACRLCVIRRNSNGASIINPSGSNVGVSYPGGLAGRVDIYTHQHDLPSDQRERHT